MNLAQESLQFLKLLFIECHKNKQLKKSFIDEPIKTLEKLTGEPNRLPAGYKVKVEDQSNPKIIYLNLPPKPKP